MPSNDGEDENSYYPISRSGKIQANQTANNNITFLMGNQSDWTAKILQPFVRSVGRFNNPVILDLGRINSRHITYFGSLCWKVYVCDFLRECKDFSDEDNRLVTQDEQISPPPWERVLNELDFVENSLHGILLWDILDIFPNVLAEELVKRLSMTLGRGGLMFSFFGPKKPDSITNDNGFKVGSENQKGKLPSFNFGNCSHFYQNSEIMTIFADFNVRHFYTMKNGYRGILIQKI